MEHILKTMKTDVLMSLDNLWKGIINNGFTFIIKALLAIIVLFIGKRVIRLLLAMIEKAFVRGKMESGIKGFLLAFLRAVFYIVLTWLILVQIFGVKDASLVAILGSAGLSIGLALQGGLSNFAGGVIILLLRPFKVGDYIIYAGNEGTVSSIDIFYTKMLTADNRLVVMPNGALSNSNVINTTNETQRRLDINIAVSHAENIDKVKGILNGIIDKNSMILKEANNQIVINNLDMGAISIGLRIWVKIEDYFSCKSELLENIKKEFDENQIKLPAGLLEVNRKI